MVEGLDFKDGYYYAEAGNPYDLEVGEEAGYFLQEVTLADVDDKENPEGAKTGGIALDSRVVRSHLAKEEGIVFALPLDPGSPEAEVFIQRVEIAVPGPYEGKGLYFLRFPDGSKVVGGMDLVGSAAVMHKLVGTIDGEPAVYAFHNPNYFFPDTDSQHLIMYAPLTVELSSDDRFLGEIGLGDEIFVGRGSFEFAPGIWKTWRGIGGGEWKLQLTFDGPSGKRGIDIAKENILAIEEKPVFVLSN